MGRIDPVLKEFLASSSAEKENGRGLDGSGNAEGVPMEVAGSPFRESNTPRQLRSRRGVSESPSEKEPRTSPQPRRSRRNSGKAQVDYAAIDGMDFIEEDFEEAEEPARRARMVSMDQLIDNKRLTRGGVSRANPPPGLGNPDGFDEEAEELPRRYPKRNRASVRLFEEDEEEEEEGGMQNVGDSDSGDLLEWQSARRRSRRIMSYNANASHKYSTRFKGEEEKDVEEEEEEEEHGRYGLRRTSRVRSEVQRYSPCQKADVRSSPRKRLRRLNRSQARQGHQAGGFSRRRQITGYSDDDLVQDRNDHLWGLVSGAGVPQGAPSFPDPGLALGATGAAALPPELAKALGLGSAGVPKAKSSEITPVAVDKSITFDDIGGLKPYVHALKEMVFLPLVYPEIFDKFRISPPRGVLLHGPPGTGKTLCARALAAAAARSGREVSFFMRKGADVLSKWVGESERQLRLLFAEAQQRQPSIIFFDEIDGLAPVRSSKQDQIHNSIVSTLLALMDGLDSRGQVVIIGATNRIDAVDSALRRPGRFDRELSFPLPNAEARSTILDIHTKKWDRQLGEDLKGELATSCVGYCGADLKALCTEAMLQALRRRYPQIYKREEKLLIDTEQVVVGREDFLKAQKMITPASHRSASVQARPLQPHVENCLREAVEDLRNVTAVLFHPAAKGLGEKMRGPVDYVKVLTEFTSAPRLLLCGMEGAGQTSAAPALLHDLEQFPCFSIGLPDLLSSPGAHTPEEALVQVVCEARKAAPSVIYLPHADVWWRSASAMLQSALLSLMRDMPSGVQTLFLATATGEADQLGQEGFMEIFGRNQVRFLEELPPEARRRALEDIAALVMGGFDPAGHDAGDGEEEEELPLAPQEERGGDGLTAKEREARAEKDEEALRQLRMMMRTQVTKLLSEHRWRVFAEPADGREQRICGDANVAPMDLLTTLSMVDKKEIVCPSDLRKAMAGIIDTANALYDSQVPEESRVISRAHSLQDTVQGWMDTLPEELVASCERIAGQRQKAKEDQEGARRVSSRRTRGEEVEEGIEHLDPEQLARKLRQEKRLAEEEAAREAEEKAAKLREEQEAKEALLAEARARAPTRQEPAGVTEVSLPPKEEVDDLLNLMVESTAGCNLERLDCYHGSLANILWSQRGEPDRRKVLELVRMIATRNPAL